MPRHKKGKLVQVKESALSPLSDHYPLNSSYVTNAGWLWVVEGYDNPSEAYECKSLATGEFGTWFPEEIRGVKRTKEQADVEA